MSGEGSSRVVSKRRKRNQAPTMTTKTQPSPDTGKTSTKTTAKARTKTKAPTIAQLKQEIEHLKKAQEESLTSFSTRIKTSTKIALRRASIVTGKGVQEMTEEALSAYLETLADDTQ
jgi:hypothetical protein